MVTLVQVDKIPQELKNRCQWVVWKSVINSGGRTTKPPFRASDPSKEASTKDPSTWASFEEAVACYRANASALGGIGFVFVKGGGIYGIDIDNEDGVEPAHMDVRRNFVNQIFSNMRTYIERSPSGKGWHVIAFGNYNAPKGTKKHRNTRTEIYGYDSFFTITGDVANGCLELTDQQEFIDLPEVQHWFKMEDPYEKGPVFETLQWRQLGLDDEDVVRMACDREGQAFYDRFNALAGCDPGEWSESFYHVVAGLDRVSGSPEQIERIVKAAPIVQDAPPTNDGVSRIAKANRIFPDILRNVRPENTEALEWREVGRIAAENIDRTNAEKRRVEEEKTKRVVEEAVRRIEDSQGKRSADAQALLDMFPELGDARRELTRPPGVVGEIVESVEKASFLPFTRYSVPNVLASLAGIIARLYKLPDGSGPTLNFILVASSASGKTDAFKATKSLVNRALQLCFATPTGPARDFLIEDGTSSIQGLWQDLQKKPSNTWFIDECATQLQKIANPKTPTDEALRDAYKKFFDLGRYDAKFQPPRSIALQRTPSSPIPNTCVSTMWVTTPGKFEITETDAVDGFLSRVTIIRHEGDYGEPNFGYKQYVFPQRLIEMLRDRMNDARALDDGYATVTEEQLILVSTTEVEQLNEQLVAIAQKITKAANLGTLPRVYVAVSRLPVIALRIAGIMAVMETPSSPSITKEQLRWAFNYLLQNLVSLLSDFDLGVIGDKQHDDVLSVVRVVRAMMGDKRYRKPLGIARADLVRRLRMVRPFFGRPPMQPSKLVEDALKRMVAEEQIKETKAETGQPGQPPRFYSPSDDPIWHM